MSSSTRRKTRNMGKNSNNPNFKEEDNKKIKAKQQRSRQEENRSNLEKSRLIMKHIPELPNDIIDLIASKFPTEVKTSLTRL